MKTHKRIFNSSKSLCSSLRGSLNYLSLLLLVAGDEDDAQIFQTLGNVAEAAMPTLIPGIFRFILSNFWAFRQLNPPSACASGRYQPRTSWILSEITSRCKRVSLGTFPPSHIFSSFCIHSCLNLLYLLLNQWSFFPFYSLNAQIPAVNHFIFI